MSQVTPKASRDPTVVLVHGAFADTSSWNPVIEVLLAAGVRVQAIANPLRGLAADTAYVASAMRQIPGPVLAVGHSYGGAIISNAATHVDNVVGLVYVAAFAPAKGETLSEVERNSRDSVLNSVLVPFQYPTDHGTGTAMELAIDVERFHDVFAADVPEQKTAIMAVTQRPVAEAAFSEPSGVVAWTSLPSWAVVATCDKAAGSDLVRSMAQRAGAITVEVDASHVVMMSQPQAVADLIMAALGSVS